MLNFRPFIFRVRVTVYQGFSNEALSKALP
jgi:hypothetical protein